MAPEQSPRAPTPRRLSPTAPAEPLVAPPPQDGPDMTWWEGPLDQALGRKVDGATSYVDATGMTLEEANALTRLR